jgi:prevent-host-death family protein
MDHVSVLDAKNRLSALLDQVEKGQEVLITRRGKPVARLVPTSETGRSQATIEKLRALRQGIAARGERFSWSELKDYRDDGRR